MGMDLASIERDLERRFAAELPEYYRRRIIFWHDDEGEFADGVRSLSLESARVLVVERGALFAAKRLLTVDDTESNFLVYVPYPYTATEENWLLPIELYSEQFRADLLSLWLGEMGLEATADMRRLARRYARFLGAQGRRATFARLAQGATTAPEMQLAMLAAISGAASREPAAILRAVLAGGLDMAVNGPYQALVRYEGAEVLWMLARQGTGYTAPEPTLMDLARHITLTALSRTLAAEQLAGLAVSSVRESQAAYCYDFIASWAADDSAALMELVSAAERELRLGERLRAVEVEALAASWIFPCIDECILTQLLTAVAGGSIDATLIASTAERRRGLTWYSGFAPYYELLAEVARMQEFYLAHAAGFHTVEARAVWQEYTADYYRMDSYYRRYHLAFARGLQTEHDDLNDLAKQVTDTVEGLYAHWFLGGLGECWNAASADELRGFGHVLEVAQQRDFYRTHVAPAAGRVFVIISDALRYEVAAELAEGLQRETQCEVQLRATAGVFPTVTKFGMAALLPHRELTVRERPNGDLQVLADGAATDAGAREKVLRTVRPASRALKYRDIAPMKRAERSALVKGMDVVYIYHDKIDEASHTADTEVFPACAAAIEELKGIVRLIRNEFGGTRIFITADHGFLYTYQPLAEDAKVDRTTPAELDVEVDRRYLITRAGAQPEFLLPVKFLDASYAAFAPRGSVRIKKKGGGLNFVHGGSSLQEMVVPVIEYHYLRSDSREYLANRAQYDTRPVTLALISASRTIGNLTFALSFYQREAVGGARRAASYRLYFADAAGTQVSDTVRIIADRMSENAREREMRATFTLRAQSYAATANYYLVIADESGEQEIVREEFTIDIPLAAEEFDFFGGEK